MISRCFMRRNVSCLLTALTAGITISQTAALNAQDGQPTGFSSTDISVALPDDGFDMALDEARQLLYVSIPNLGKVVAISTVSYEIVSEFNVGSSPHGIDISLDGTRLFVAQWGSGGVAIVDLESGDRRFIDISVELGDDRTFEVVEAQPNRIFVTAGPGTLGLAYVVQVRLDQGNAAQRVANGRVFRSRPSLEPSPDQSFLYVGEGLSPNKIFKLDLMQNDAPVLQEVAVRDSRHLEVSPDGDSIYSKSEIVLRTASFTRVGEVEDGWAQFGETSDIVYVVHTIPRGLFVFETQTYRQIAEIDLACRFDDIRRMIVLPGDSGWLVLGDDVVCGRLGGALCSAAPSVPATPTPPVGAPGVSVGATLEWQGGEAECPTNFDVLFGTENPPTEPLCHSVPDRMCVPGSLEPSTTYYWQVRAHNDAGSTLGPVWSFTTNECADPTIPEDAQFELDGLTFDMALDEARQLLYVSNVVLHELQIVSIESLQIVARLPMYTPIGIDISLDGTRLFVALGRSGAVAVVDLETWETSEIVLEGILGHPGTFDVVEALPNRLFVTAAPGSGGSAFVVMVKLDEGNAAQRVASRRIIRSRPVLEPSPDRRFLYVGEGFNPNSLYKLDITREDAPIILENRHGTVSGTDHLEVSADGDRIFLGSGQVLSTETFQQVGSVGDGVPRYGDGDDLVYVARRPDMIDIYDGQTFQWMDAVTVACSFDRLAQLIVLPDQAGYLVLGGELLCYYGIPESPLAPGDPLPSNDAGCRPLDTILSWRSGDGGCLFTRYDVYLGETNPPTETICTNTTATSCDPGLLEAARWYYWQVIAKNRGGVSPSPVWSFTTEGFVVPLNVDIKPRACPNVLNRNSRGVLPVGLLGTPEFDVTTIDLASVRLSRADGIGGEVASLEGPPGPHSTIEDVGTPFEGQPCDCHEFGGDGIDDLAMKFSVEELIRVLQLNDFPAGAVVELVVQGMLNDGCEFTATDCVRFVPPTRGEGRLQISEGREADAHTRHQLTDVSQEAKTDARDVRSSDSADTAPPVCGAMLPGSFFAISACWLLLGPPLLRSRRNLRVPPA